jgi:hypothetical protein
MQWAVFVLCNIAVVLSISAALHRQRFQEVWEVFRFLRMIGYLLLSYIVGYIGVFWLHDLVTGAKLQVEGLAFFSLWHILLVAVPLVCIFVVCNFFLARPQLLGRR